MREARRPTDTGRSAALRARSAALAGRPRRDGAVAQDAGHGVSVPGMGSEDGAPTEIVRGHRRVIGGADDVAVRRRATFRRFVAVTSVTSACLLVLGTAALAQPAPNVDTAATAPAVTPA